MRRSPVILGLGLILAACGTFATPEVPLFTIRNESERPVDLYRISRAHGQPQGPDLVTTLMPGDTFATEFGEHRCSTDYTFTAEVDGQEVAEFGPRLCSGRTEIIEADATSN